MTKPPIGLRPKSNYLDDRRNEVYEAMVRYRESDKEIPQHWIIEYSPPPIFS